MDHIRVSAGLLAALAAALIVPMACGGDDSSEPRAITALPSATPTPQVESVGALPLERFVYEASLKLQYSLLRLRLRPKPPPPAEPDLGQLPVGL